MATKQDQLVLGVGEKFLQEHVEDDQDSYKGLPIHAAPGLHAEVARILAEHGYVPGAGRAVDLAAGAGPMTLRLRDAGYAVLAVDRLEHRFRVDGADVRFLARDLNEPFAEALPDKVRLVTAIEIIEHLENPRSFLRECVRALARDGALMLTTPNINSTYSKARFVRQDAFHWFTDQDYVQHGHITPLTTGQLYKMFHECDLRVEAHATHGADAFRYREWRSMWLLQKIIAVVGRTPSWGDGGVHIFLLKPRQP